MFYRDHQGSGEKGATLVEGKKIRRTEDRLFEKAVALWLIHAQTRV